jgi:hypothetical protein
VDYLESAAEGLPEHPLVRYHLARAAELVGEDDDLGDRIKEALG